MENSQQNFEKDKIDEKIKQSQSNNKFFNCALHNLMRTVLQLNVII